LEIFVDDEELPSLLVENVEVLPESPISETTRDLGSLFSQEEEESVMPASQLPIDYGGFGSPSEFRVAPEPTLIILPPRFVCLGRGKRPGYHSNGLRKSEQMPTEDDGHSLETEWNREAQRKGTFLMEGLDRFNEDEM
jgi:hypothetical protein